jgi:DNA-binding transcriptional LysR family regulator
VNSYTSVIEAVKLGLGLGLLSGEVIETEMRAGRLVEVLPGAAPPPIDLWVVYPSKNLVSPAVRALIEHIQGTFSSTLPRAERIARKERAKTI